MTIKIIPLRILQLSCECECGAVYPYKSERGIQYTNEEQLRRDAYSFGWTPVDCPECARKKLTPPCPECGHNDHWIIGRKLYERKSWNPLAERLEDSDIECTELWISCGECGYEADAVEDGAIFTLLEDK